jgi:DNA repair photolyase
VLRLPWEVNPLFQQWLQAHFPDRAARISRTRDMMRGGRDNDARFGSRMRGQGIWAELLRQRFDKACMRLKLNRERIELDLGAFRRPQPPAAQASLF